MVLYKYINDYSFMDNRAENVKMPALRSRPYMEIKNKTLVLCVERLGKLLAMATAVSIAIPILKFTS